MHFVAHRAVHGIGAVAVTPHELSTGAAVELIGSGGNAVDAAIAANAVQGVVAPETCGIGGDLFALVQEPGRREPACLNASGRAGAGACAATLREIGAASVPTYGHESITVPGCVDGWFALNARFGRVPLKRVLAPALRHARDGFVVSKELGRAWSASADRLADQPSAPPMFPGGRPPSPGQIITRPLLAESIEAVLNGRDSFYMDRLAEPIARATHGAITRDDMAGDQAEWVEAISTGLFGMTAWTVPPNSQGYLTLATLGVFSRLDAPTDADDPAFVHALIESYRAVAVDLGEWVSDPRTAPVPPAHLLDSDRLDAVAQQVGASRDERRPRQVSGSPGTAYLCVIDGDGMAVSLIQSNYHGIGSGISAGDTGVWLHNRGAGFNLRPGHPNELAPGRRPLHTLSPTLWTDDDRASLILGTRGGHHQPQLLAQVAALRHHNGLNLVDAQTHPRWSIGAEDSAVSVEPRMAAGLTAGLERRGHHVSEAEPFMAGWGPVAAIEVAPSGVRTGVADPRVDTAAAAVR